MITQEQLEKHIDDFSQEAVWFITELKRERDEALAKMKIYRRVACRIFQDSKTKVTKAGFEIPIWEDVERIIDGDAEKLLRESKTSLTEDKGGINDLVGMDLPISFRVDGWSLQP